MIWFKACSKCGGDLHLAVDIHGKYVQCFQCSRIIEERPANVDSLPQGRPVRVKTPKARKLKLVS